MRHKTLTIVATLQLWCLVLATEKAPASVPIQAHASHILVDTEAQADELNAQLSATANLSVMFAKLAKEHSKCPSGRKGGDLGVFGRGQMVPEFDKVAFGGEIGVVHKVKTQFGWHLVLVTRRIDGVEEPSMLYDIKQALYKSMPFLGPLLLVLFVAYGIRKSQSGPRARAYHILVKSEAEADALYTEIAASMDPKLKLAEMAATHSTCPSGKKGGDLGMFGRGDMVPQFDKIVFESDVGKVAKVQTQFGWHVLLCTERVGDAKKLK